MWNPFDAEGYLKVFSAGIGVLMAGGGGIYTAYQWHDSTYAKQDDVLQIEMRLEQKIQGDRLNQIQQRMWRLEDRYGESLNARDNETAWEEYRQLKDERDRLISDLHNRPSMQQYRQPQAPVEKSP